MTSSFENFINAELPKRPYTLDTYASFESGAGRPLVTTGVGLGVTLGNFPSVPVLSVNSNTGNVVLTASDVGALATSARGDINGVAELVEGVIPTNRLPAIAITDVFPVSSQAAMLALDAQKGDVAIRSDVPGTYILAADGASTLSNWLLLPTPTDHVLSVNGQTGVVVLSHSDVGADASGAAASAQSAAQGYADGLLSGHLSASDPHTQYTTTAEAAAAAPVQSVNSSTGNVTVNAATSASFVTTTGVLTLSKNNGQTADTLSLAPLDWTIATLGDTAAVTNGALVVAPSSNLSFCVFNLPAGANGSSVTFRVVAASGQVAHQVVPNGTNTISGGVAGATYFLYFPGMYYFRYYSSTWNVVFVPQVSPETWTTVDALAITATINCSYCAYNTTITLPAAGVADGESIRVKPYIANSAASKQGAVTIASSGTRYIRARGAGGTATTLSTDSTVGLLNNVTYTFTWNATDACWYYHYSYDGATFLNGNFSLTESLKTVNFNIASVAALATRTITVPNYSLSLAGIPAYNTLNSNVIPSSTESAILAGNTNTSSNVRQCITSAVNFNNTNVGAGVEIMGNGSTSVVPQTKTFVVRMTLKTRVVGTATAYPTEDGTNASTGTLTKHPPAVLFSNKPPSVDGFGTHMVDFVGVSDDGKMYVGKRRIIYRYNGTTYTQVSNEVIGTDQDPNTMSPTIGVAVSNGYLVISFAYPGAGPSGLTSWHCYYQSMYNHA